MPKGFKREDFYREEMFKIRNEDLDSRFLMRKYFQSENNMIP